MVIFILGWKNNETDDENGGGFTISVLESNINEIKLYKNPIELSINSNINITDILDLSYINRLSDSTNDINKNELDKCIEYNLNSTDKTNNHIYYLTKMEIIVIINFKDNLLDSNNINTYQNLNLILILIHK